MEGRGGEEVDGGERRGGEKGRSGRGTGGGGSQPQSVVA